MSLLVTVRRRSNLVAPLGTQSVTISLFRFLHLLYTDRYSCLSLCPRFYRSISLRVFLPGCFAGNL